MTGFFRQRKTRALEKLLPSALFSFASFAPNTPVEKIISAVERDSKEPLKSALGFLGKQLSAGLSLPQALSKLRGLYSSPLLDRVTLLLEASYKSGAELSEAYREVAEDAFAFQQMEDERNASFAIQKYTLFAGVVLVPSLLGHLFSWASSSISGIVWLGLHAYLFFFCVLSALFISAVERQLSKTFVYAFFFLPVCFAAFYFASGKVGLVI